MNEDVGSVRLLHARTHPVLDATAPWSVQGVQLSTAGGQGRVRVTLLVTREGVRQRLRFDGVTDLTLRSGRPALPVRILDVTHLQWRGVAVRVETECGELGFWAGSVVALDGTADRSDATALPNRVPPVNRRDGAARRRTPPHEA